MNGIKGREAEVSEVFDSPLYHKLEAAKKTVVAEAKAACKSRGYHTWDHKFGRRYSGGGKPLPRHPLLSDPGDAPVYSETWSQFARICLDCGEKQVEEDQNVWRYDAGLGHYECDPRTGKSKWIENKEGRRG